MADSKIGNYRIVRKLGEGGMGAVFEAIHEEIERRVAIKVLHPEFARNPEFTSRFFNEARAVNRVEHLGLVQVSDYGRLPDGTAYIVMELLKGESLGSRLKRLGGPLPVEETVYLARQVADALSAAHEKSIVHRDLKPDNVMIIPDPAMPCGERAKLLDFGIAKLAETFGKEQPKTRTNALMGTPAYMSPEQCRGAGSVDDKSDVYSLGVMLYVMLIGRQPFTGEGTGEILAKHIYETPPPLPTIAPWLPSDLAELVHSLLAKDKHLRPTMRQVVAALDLFEEQHAPQHRRSNAKLPVMPPVPGTPTLLDRPSTLGLSAAQNHRPVSLTRRSIAWALTASGVATVAAVLYFSRAPQMTGAGSGIGQPAVKQASPAPSNKLIGHQEKTPGINQAADVKVEETRTELPKSFQATLSEKKGRSVAMAQPGTPAFPAREKKTSGIRFRDLRPESLNKASASHAPTLASPLPSSIDKPRPARHFEE